MYASQKVRTLHIRAGNTDQFTILGCCIIDGPLSNCINFLEIVFSGHENYAGIYLSFGPKCASNTYLCTYVYLANMITWVCCAKAKSTPVSWDFKFRWGNQSKIISSLNLCNKAMLIKTTCDLNLVSSFQLNGLS